MKATEMNRLRKVRIYHLEKVLRKIRVDLKALRNRIENSTDRILLSSRIEMINKILEKENEKHG